MKIKFLLPVLLLVLLSSISCVKKANEIGYESILFYKNGEKVVPSCLNKLISINQVSNDTISIGICIDKNLLIYKINNFNNEGMYYFDSATQNHAYINDEYNSRQTILDNRRTYLHILEFDSIKGYVRGLFGAEYISYTSSQDIIRITKGRFDLPYKKN